MTWVLKLILPALLGPLLPMELLVASPGQ